MRSIYLVLVDARLLRERVGLARAASRFTQLHQELAWRLQNLHDLAMTFVASLARLVERRATVFVAQVGVGSVSKQRL